MKFFACLLDTDRHGISARASERVEAAAARYAPEYRWDRFPSAAILTGWDGDGGDIRIEASATHIAVGSARLDNRGEIRKLLDNHDDRSDLGIILQAVARFGSKCIPSLVGDFAFVVWHAQTRSVIAASDTFASRPLYYAQHDGITLFGSRTEPLSADGRYDRAYLADILLLDCLTPGQTVYSGVSRVLPASTITVQHHAISTSTYWNAMDFEPTGSPLTEADAIHAVRDLFLESVRLRVGANGRTWSQLSGGLDSSSVVSTVQWLADHGQISTGLAGTATFVDSSDSGSDERPFVNAVLERWQVPNRALVDLPSWLDADGPSHQLPDQPPKALSLYPRNCLLHALLRDARAEVLLTGWGGDHLFNGDMMYLADRLVRSPLQALREMAHICALGRVPFWTFAYQNALTPLLPMLQQRALRKGVLIPDWLRLSTFRSLGITTHVRDVRYDGRVGHKYFHHILSQVSQLDMYDDWFVVDEVVSVRHPFLYRPLVEMALRLPPEFCVRPHARKWVFRHAMKGILPEMIRTRVGKGAGGDFIARMFVNHRESLKRLSRESVLADLGLVDLRRLQIAIDRATASAPTAQGMELHGQLSRTLSVESWLRVRSGRWPHGVHMPLQSVRQHHTTDLAVT